MSSPQLLLRGRAVLQKCFKRNIAVSYPALQKVSDPIQQLFVEKIREYKKKSSGGKLVDPSPEIEREWQQELGRLVRVYGSDKATDMTKFPEFKFTDPPLDPINSAE